ncbi:MAG: hypothetical protein L0K03_09295 [Bifidobacterium crudilactis]|nr:hypothetical protein [Bifidobacterium crudilactis]
MPWWIWLVITIGMFVVLGVGAWYVVTHALRAMGKVSQLGSTVNEKFAALNQPSADAESTEPPLFTRDLRVASERYATAHARVVERKADRRVKHMQRWEPWKPFNE